MTYDEAISNLKEGVVYIQRGNAQLKNSSIVFVARRPSWDLSSFIKLSENGVIQDKNGNTFPQQKHLQDLKANDWETGSRIEAK